MHRNALLKRPLNARPSPDHPQPKQPMTAYYHVNFTCADNEDLRQAFQLTDGSGAPVDLSGAQLRMRIDTVPPIDATTANSRVMINGPTAGAFEIGIPASVMRQQKPGVYAHDLLLILGSNTTRLWTGSVALDHGVTP